MNNKDGKPDPSQDRLDVTSSGHLQALLENTEDAVSILDLDGNIVSMNGVPGGVLDPAGFVGKDPADYLEGEYAGIWREALSGVIAGGEPVTVEIVSVLGRQWRTRMVPVLEGGEVVSVMTIGSDVTQMRKAQDDLLDSEARLKLAMEAADIGMWEWRIVEGSVAWDAQTYSVFGVEPGSSVDFSVYSSCLHPDDRQRVLQNVQSSVEVGQVESFDHRIVRPDSEIRWVRCHGKIRFVDDTPVALVGSIFDITDARAVEAKLRQVQKMEALGRLTAGIAHNFNNMLTAILPNIELALMDAPESLVERLEEAEAASLRASEMIRQLMIFSRPSVGTGLRTLDLRQIATEVCDISRRTFNRRISVVLDLPPEPVILMGDATQLEQALLNVCLNARDAVQTHPEPEISVKVLVREGRGVVEVRDNGVGVPIDSLSRIFEPFFSTKAVGKGTGLGLATSYAIVQDHQGELRCESDVGQGALFTLEIPLSDEPVQPVHAKVPAALPRGTETVLVVDDEPPVRRAISSMLRFHGYQVSEASNGLEALKFLDENDNLDMLIVDLWMPAMTGEELLSRLPMSRPYKVVVLSGAPVDDIVSSKVDGVWSKPVRARRLLKDARTILEG